MTERQTRVSHQQLRQRCIGHLTLDQCGDCALGSDVAINGEGVVVASYSNGRQINISQLVLAKFQNPGGLKLAGANRYIAPAEVGTIRVGLPGPELGKLFTNSLEQSNVDLATELVKMINYQRAFQANSKAISTTDDMLAELIQLKR